MIQLRAADAAIFSALVVLAGCASSARETSGRNACAALSRAPDPMLAAALDEKIDAAVGEGFSGQVAILKDGALLYARAAGSADLAGNVPVTEETLYHVASLTKYFTAVLVLKAVEEGRLSLDAPAAELFPETALAARDFTIADLLAHRGGFRSTYAAESEATQEGAIAAIAAANREEQAPKATPGENSPLPLGEGSGVRVASSPPASEPSPPAPLPEGEGGRPFQYSNDGYDLLAILLERTYRTPYETLFREKIAAPACLEDFGFWGETALADPTARGQPLRPASEQLSRRNYGMIGSAGLLISANDLVRFGDALRAGSLLAPSSLAELRAPRGSVRIGEVLYGAFRIDTPLGKAVSARGAEDWGDNAYLNDYSACGAIVAVATSRGPAEGSGKPLWRDALIAEAENLIVCEA